MAKERKGVSRRWVILGGVTAAGGLAVAYALTPYSRLGEQIALLAKEGEVVLGGWVRIGKDSRVTVIVPHADMGVGNGTALAQMLAEELDADWPQVTYERAPGEMAFANWGLAQGFLRGDSSIPEALAGTAQFGFRKISEVMRLQITGGSTAVRFTGVDGMRYSGAAARAMLVAAAAKSWGVAEAEIKVAKGRITHASGKDEGFGAFVEAAAQMSIPSAPKLKDPKTYSIVGQSKERIDIPAKVDGTAQYSGDIRLPGLVFASIRNCPVPGGTLKSVDETSIKGRRGVSKVVRLPSAIAVIADNSWRAKEAALSIDPQWDEGANAKMSSADTIKAQAAAIKAGKLESEIAEGDVAVAMKSAAKVVSHDYTMPYLCHAQMEPIGCVVQWKDGKLDIWGAFQNALGAKFEAAEVAGVAPEKVTVHNTAMGGSFGRRIYHDYLTRAVLIAKQTDGAPVSVQYTREEDMTQGLYRNCTAATLRMGFDAAGKPVAIQHHYAEKHDPGEASQILYDVPAKDVSHVKGISQAPWGAWRSVDHSVHGFLIESFMDEAARDAGKDPYQFRRDLLASKPAHRAVLDAVAEKSGWKSYQPTGRSGLGIALVESFGTIVAQVVEAEVAPDGTIKVKTVWVAADPGEVINPDGFTAQMQSGVIYALSAALLDEITYENGRVVQQNFTDYPVMLMADAPAIHVTLVPSGRRTGGGGEPGTPPAAAALANAVHAATGKRVRDLPLSKADLKA